MLAEVAARKISPLHVVAPNRQMTKRVRWVQAEVCSIDAEKKEIAHQTPRGDAQKLRYSQLILACGSVVRMDKIPGLAARGFVLKTVEDAMRMGNQFIGMFEAASAEIDPEERRRLLTTVVVGGGFSGTEIAAHLSDFSREIRCFYPELEDIESRIVLLQHGARILPELQHQELSDYTKQILSGNGVEVRLKTGLKEMTPTAAIADHGEEIDCGMVVCTIGNDTVDLIKNSGFVFEKGRLKTEPDMRLENEDSIFAIGDCALTVTAETGEPSPATAQFATRQAEQLAKNLRRIHDGQATVAFSHKPLGLLAAIGHRNAVAEILGVKLSGLVAWFLWRGIYLMKRPGLSRKVEVGIGWIGDIIFKPNICQLYPPE